MKKLVPTCPQCDHPVDSHVAWASPVQLGCPVVSVFVTSNAPQQFKACPCRLSREQVREQLARGQVYRTVRLGVEPWDGRVSADSLADLQVKVREFKARNLKPRGIIRSTGDQAVDRIDRLERYCRVLATRIRALETRGRHKKPVDKPKPRGKITGRTRKPR